MPRMRDASRSGWKASSASIFSPMPRNLIGLPVTSRIDNAAPPRASPSVFVRIIPVNASASLNAFEVFTASWPVMLSATNRVSTGSIAACTALISAIISSSTCRRPAVSMMTTSQPFFFAASMALTAISTGFSSALDGKKTASTCVASVFNCSIAAGR